MPRLDRSSGDWGKTSTAKSELSDLHEHPTNECRLIGPNGAWVSAKMREDMWGDLQSEHQGVGRHTIRYFE